MNVDNLEWRPETAWTVRSQTVDPLEAQLVLYFGDREQLADGVRHEELASRYPKAVILGCSGGSVLGPRMAHDVSITAVAVSCRAARVVLARTELAIHATQEECGRALVRQLDGPELSGIFVLGDGTKVNGSALLRGMRDALDRDVPLSGGLAGDEARFEETLVAANAPPRAGVVAAVGFHGAAVQLTTGVGSGWTVFGPHRSISRSAGNVLFELDGEPTLDLYRRYLGDEAEGLPGTALLFPLRVFHPDRPDHAVVRTVLAISETDGSMTFAGDVPHGWVAQLMRSTVSRLSAAAASATRGTVDACQHDDQPALAIQVNCIGRRLAMGERYVEETADVLEQLPPAFAHLGFYSHGEMAAHQGSQALELHNQTVVMTLLTERG